MKKTSNKLLSLLLALIMTLSCVTPVLAEGGTGFDNSTTLADGEYSGSDVEFTWSGGTGKVKLTLNKVVVAGGKATAEFTVSSANMTHIYLGTAEGDGEIPALYDPETGAVGQDVYAFADKKVTIPVRLNEEVGFAMHTVAMSNPHWINYNYTITVAEPEGFDNSTDVADGEYEAPQAELTWSGGTGKVKLTLNKVVVAGGKATAEFTVSSANMTYVYLGTAEGEGEIPALYDPETGAVGQDVYAFADKKVTIPVRLNEEVAFAMRTVAMSNPHWINYTYTITVTTEPVEADADYTAVDAALAKIPADLSIYTDESVKAVIEARDAVVRGLKAGEQAKVDAMAKAIEDAVAGLVRKPVDGRVDLTIINNTGMFKGAYAYLLTENGQSSLVVALTGTTYHYLFRGTYAEALANGDNRDNWMKYRESASGKYEFVLPLAGNESYIPVVSISNSYLTKYEKGENPLERAFYPRQFELDREAKTLTVGDYDETVTAAVKSNVEDFKAAETAQMRVVGGPNSNNYNVAPVLQMLDDTYDQVTYPTVVNGKVGTATAELTADKTFTISLLNAPNKEAFRDKEPIGMQFRVKATGELVTYQVTIDLLAKTITIDAQKAAYTVVSGGDGQWTKGSGKDFEIVVKRSVADETTFSRFTGVLVDGKALDKANYEAVAGSVKVTLKAAYLETLSAGKHTVTVTLDDGQAETSITIAQAGKDSPKTGDNGVMLWAAMAVISAGAAVVLKRKKDEAAA